MANDEYITAEALEVNTKEKVGTLHSSATPTCAATQGGWVFTSHFGFWLTTMSWSCVPAILVRLIQKSIVFWEPNKFLQTSSSIIMNDAWLSQGIVDLKGFGF